jgi:hypothetical protein
MTVSIDIDLNAKGIADEIVTIRGALETLDETSEDIDLSGKIDVDGLTGDLGQVVKKLKNVEDQIGNLESRIKNVSENIDMDDITVTHKTESDSADGSTGSGDSTGGDPPWSRERHRDSLGKLFGKEFSQVIGSDSLSKWKHDGAPWANASVGLTDSEKAGIHPKAVRGRFGMGLESLDQSRIRQSELSPEEIAEMATLPDRSDSEAGRETGLKEFSDSEILDIIASRRGVDRDKMGVQGRNITYDSDEFGFESLESFLDRRNNLSAEEIDSQASARNKPDLEADTPHNRFKRTRFGKSLNKAENVSDLMDNVRSSQGRLTRVFKKAFPSMGKYMQLLAALIPIAVSLGSQLLGVAAAMGAVGVAGASIIGLGLLGHGDNMASSFAQAKKEIQDLKREMFDSVQPLAQTFAPIQARMFDALPGGMSGIFDEMQGLAGFEGLLFDLGGSAASGIERFFRIINENRGIISELTEEMGGMLGTGLLNFFEWLIQNAAENKQLMLDTIASLKSLAVAGFNIAMVVTKIVAAFRPLFAILAKIAKVLNNRFIIGFLSFIAVAATVLIITSKVIFALYGMGSAIMRVVGLLQFLGSGSILAGIKMAFTLIISYTQVAIAEMTALQVAALGAAAAIAATGIGAALVLGGGAAYQAMKPDVPSGSGSGYGGSGGGSRVYNDNRSYEINQRGTQDYAEQKRMEKTIRDVNESNDAQELPPLDN